jgi:uncharacterized protein YbaA (DUF1428 family)
MAYIDGFLIPIQKKNVAKYRRIACTAAYGGFNVIVDEAL